MLGNIFTASKDWDIDVVIFLGWGCILSQVLVPITCPALQGRWQVSV